MAVQVRYGGIFRGGCGARPPFLLVSAWRGVAVADALVGGNRVYVFADSNAAVSRVGRSRDCAPDGLVLGQFDILEQRADFGSGLHTLCLHD